ncbi:MAG: C/D box methylation guide ribonucleoprotein complex aNOP56 subunit [Candidatus Lokiarchaeota archaeon]|nr:C/D box methylation guide ribonucleoprotein complex aNOP56 subunit [Candidatus Lokiarchaeota archaeon]
MRCYIIDSLIGIYAIDDGGNFLNFIDFLDDIEKSVSFYNSLNSDSLSEEYSDIMTELSSSGFDDFVFDNKKLKELTKQKLGYNTSIEKFSLEFKNFRFNLSDQLKKIGITKTRNEILFFFKKVEEQLIKNKVSQFGSKGDVEVIQVIETLDILKKSISLFSSRMREWYGLYFPELTDKLIEENILIAKLITILGKRDNFTYEKIGQEFSFKESRISMLQKLASQSMGGDIDLSIIKKYADEILSLDDFRQELEDYLDTLMEQVAPNLFALVGGLIGAKLIAKAGSLKKLAFMPASRIQLLGAEKALYRFLKTGEKRPKHGLIFQWNQIRGSKPWNRGKISRVISGKIGISAKVDFFGGEFVADVLSKEINKKIQEIEKKYPKPPLKRSEPKTKISSSKKQASKKKRR